VANSNDYKRAAAEAALDYIEEGETIGIGTGSTVNFLIDALADSRTRIAAAVSSSEATTRLLKQHNIEVVELNTAGDLPLYIDGADEATHHRHLIKGGGGALTREKIIAGASQKFVCIADESKLVGTLGAFPLPVEVIPMARSFVSRKMVGLGGQPAWREGVVTDNGNEIIDVHNLKITEPAKLEQTINNIPGVVTVGLFAMRGADVLLIAGKDGVKKI